jgi:ABC-type glycerol-3-phosphate transport system substrate-binding protein
MTKVRKICLFACIGLMVLSIGAWAAGSKDAAVDTKVVNIWTKFNDTNPQNTQDEWLVSAIAQIKADKGIELKNTFVPYDQIVNKVNLAVQAGGDVPDVSYVDGSIDFFVNNGTLMDLTDFVKKASWFKDISPAALKAVTAADGKIYAVPGNVGGNMMYYWTAAYPNGAPKTTADLLAAGERLAKEGKFAITFKGSERTGANTFYFMLAGSLGAQYTNAKGESVFAVPETVKAVELVRELFAKRYAPELALAAGFDWENPFKDGNAGAFVAGTWSYVYLNPLKSPDGKVFDHGANSVEEAIKAGALAISDPITMPGGKPISQIGLALWGIPVGSKNVAGAKDFLDFMMQTKNNADYAVAYGGLPVLDSSMKDSRFVNSRYWQDVNASINRHGMVPYMNKNPRLAQRLNDVIITLIQRPNLDIMTELKKAQDELNAGN